LEWRLDPETALAPNSREIKVDFIQPSGCSSGRRLSSKIEYRPTEVALGLLLDFVPSCLESGGPADARFDLTEPLGNRRIVPLDLPNLTPDDFVPPHPPTIDPAFLSDPRL